MKIKWIFLILLLSSASLLITCNKPHDEQDPNDPPDPVNKDSVSGFAEVPANPFIINEADFSGYLEHFFIDSSIYVFSGGNIVYDAEMMEAGMNGEFKFLKTIYSSTHTSQILDVTYDEPNGRFLVAGGVKDKYDYIYANPILKIYDMEGNLITDKYYSWDQADNYFVNIQFLPPDEIALLGYERESNYNYSYHRFFCMILNSSYDSLRRFNLPFDSIVSVNYFRFISPVEIEMVGIRQNGHNPENPEKLFYKLFYMKFSPGGMITESYDIRDYVFGTGNIYIDEHDPAMVFYYEKTGRPDSRIFWEKYSFNGSLIGSGMLSILNHNKIQPSYNAISISSLDGGLIVSGQFVKDNSPSAPTYYGNFLIKYDPDMVEKYRLIFNKEFQDIQLWMSSVDEIEPDRFLFLSDYSASFVMTFINAADTVGN